MPVTLSKPIPYGRQDISEADIRAVADVLRSDWLTQGPAIPRFENEVAKYCGVNHALAVCNATSALHLACRALGLGPGDRLWTSPNTFVASANCALYCGATVDFVDIDPQTYNMCAKALEEKLSIAAKAGRLPKIVIPVAFAGQSADMRAIAELGKQYGFRIIEDASHAIGGEYNGRKIGCCEFADITVFSFHPVKIITTGEGGMLLTNQADVYSRLGLLRTHGITRDFAQMSTQRANEPWYYEQIELGYNYRITDIQAALGASQMDRLDEFVQRRRQLAERYTRRLATLPLNTPQQDPHTKSAWHLYVVWIDPGRTSKRRQEVFASMRNAGILVNVHYIPVHLQPFYRSLGFARGDFPQSESYYANAISLPLYAGLSDDEQDYVIATLRESLA